MESAVFVGVFDRDSDRLNENTSSYLRPNETRYMGLIPYIQRLTSTATESIHTGDLVASRVLGIPRPTASLLVDRRLVVSFGLPRSPVGTPPHPVFLLIYISISLTHRIFGVWEKSGLENLVSGIWCAPEPETYFLE